ncbi:MAG TPA: S-adenosylmethionine:tRNA ribosyltransferase-isomerase [Flavobacteriales bacterium]|nr:S-adenosylmethionine:tRNA ribosyltransferase-isomerase [Flavobacteriales bacterium]
MNSRELAIADFTYVLPEDRIAQEPLAERDASKLLVCRNGVITDRTFRDVADELPANALLVLNDTRVVNARLVFHRSTGARIEVLCLSPADGAPVERAFAQRGSATWECFVGNAKRWKEGEELELQAGNLILRAARSGADHVRFTWSPGELTFADVLAQLGHVPLPPYMKRPDAEADKERYNTVFSHHAGSVAAPTASLHFTTELLRALEQRGIRKAQLTLHVGAGTFLPVKSERMADHRMHTEQVRVPLEALVAVREQLGKGPIVTVGTTALRTLESVYWHGAQLLRGTAGAEISIGQWEPYEERDNEPTAQEALDAVVDSLNTRGEDRLIGTTSLLIAPGYRFRFVDGLITNFHQPQSTLLLLVAAFVGPGWRAIYDHALAKDYRFLSYGDGSLLFRGTGMGA